MTIHVVVHKLDESTGKSWKMRLEFDSYSDVDIERIEEGESHSADRFSETPTITATVENVFVV